MVIFISSRAVVEKWPKIAKKGLKWPIMVQICLILSEIAQNCLKLCKITKKCHCGPFWVINDHLWSFWISIDLFGTFWALFGNFWPFFHNRSGAYKNDQKLKHDLDYQMSTKMVQENHEDNFNTQWYQYEILVYFGTIYMEHPVQEWGWLWWGGGCSVPVIMRIVGNSR